MASADFYFADENTGTQIYDGNIYSGVYIIGGPSSNALGLPSSENRTFSYYSSDTSFTMSDFVPPDGLCKFRFTIYSDALSSFSDGLVARFSATPYIVYNGVRYDMIQYDDYWVSTFYAEASSDTNVIGVPVQFDLIFENFSSSGTYSTSFRIESIFLRCWSIESSEEAILEEMNSLLEDLKAELEANGDLTEEIKTLIDSILSDTGRIDSRLQDLYLLLDSYGDTYFRPILNNLKDINAVLHQIYSEEQKQTTWLEKIWQSLQDLFSGSYGGSSVPENPDGSVGFDTEIPGSDSSGSGSGSSSGSQDDEKVGFFDMVADFFGNFFGNLMNAVKGLFVPDEEYLGDFFTRLNDFFSEKLGFLYVPIDLLIQLLNALLSAEPGTASLPLPEFSWEGQVVLSAQNVNLDLSKDFPQLQSMLHFATNVMLIGAVLNLLQNKLKEMLQ